MKRDVSAGYKKELYFGDYDSLTKFVSYFYQTDLVKRLPVKTVLEIGVGSRVLGDYLKRMDRELTSIDINANLSPNCVADLRKLPFKDKAFEVAVAFQVLEHMPWKDVNKAVNELSRVTQKYALISLPYSGMVMEVMMRIPVLGWLVDKKYFYTKFAMDNFWLKQKPGGEHFWEVGKKGYPRDKIRKVLEKYFVIEREVWPKFNPYEYFWVLKKK